MCLHVYLDTMDVKVSAETSRGYQKETCSYILVVSYLMWVLGAESWSSVRAACALETPEPFLSSSQLLHFMNHMLGSAD